MSEPTRDITLFRSGDMIAYAVRIFANLVPLGAVLFAGWDAAELLILYWAENFIPGFYNVLRILLSRAEIGDSRFRSRWGAKLFYMLLFTLCFGIFLLSSGGLIMVVIVVERGAALNSADVKALFHPLVWPLFALFLSHGVSFLQDVRAGQAGDAKMIRGQVTRPFLNVFLLQGAIFAAFFLFLAVGGTGAPVLLAIFVGFKTGLDLYLYARSRRAEPQTLAPGETLAPPIDAE